MLIILHMFQITSRLTVPLSRNYRKLKFLPSKSSRSDPEPRRGREQDFDGVVRRRRLLSDNTRDCAPHFDSILGQRR